MVLRYLTQRVNGTGKYWPAVHRKSHPASKLPGGFSHSDPEVSMAAFAKSWRRQ
jgi:hypothetical protein